MVGNTEGWKRRENERGEEKGRSKQTNVDRENHKGREFPPHHIVTGCQFEQNPAVLVELMQRPVKQRNQINVATDRLICSAQLSQDGLLGT